jgi:hypothetical protein
MVMQSCLKVWCASLAAGAVLGASPLMAQSAATVPTFAKDVAPILYNRCVSCHRRGEVAPMPLQTYDEARPWVRSIKSMVVKREMPPWFADPAHGKFKDDRRLTQREIDTLVAWVDGGAPRGSDADLPPAPKFVEGWQRGEPDFVFELPEVDIPAEGQVDIQYRWVRIPFESDRFAQAMELRPSNPAVLHHARADVVDLPEGARIVDGKVVFEDGAASEFDRRRNRPSVDGFSFARSTLISFIPGSNLEVHRPGTAKRLDAGKYVRVELHYTPSGAPAKDRTRLGVWFAKGAVTHEVFTILNARALVPGPGAEPEFTVNGKRLQPSPGTGGRPGRIEFPNIAPHEENYEVIAVMPVTAPITITSMLPHMHLRGKDLTWTVTYPDGREEVVLRVPKYDFNWQILYEFERPLKLPAGSRIKAVAHYDNSANNRVNPAPQNEVYWSDQSWDEMFVPYMEYTIDDQDLSRKASTAQPR